MEQLVILAMFNLLELTGGADIAELECRRGLRGGYPSLLWLPFRMTNDLYLPHTSLSFVCTGLRSQVSSSKYAMSNSTLKVKLADNISHNLSFKRLTKFQAFHNVRFNYLVSFRKRSWFWLQ